MENTAEPEIVEEFYGVYLLYNINPKFKGRTYIGYTRDPNRRIMQHNRGTWAGGAHRTSNRGPWKMVMIVHGFPNNISALRFEWAWQNPSKTTRLQHLDLKKIPRKESEYQFKLRVLSEMLRVGPWCRLPLVIRWLENEYREDFPPERKPPDHMPIIQGPVKSCNRRKNKHITTVPTIKCLLCSGYLKDDQKLRCTNVNCDLVSHLNCLANLFLPPGEYIPIHGNCPFCNTKLKWGDLIRKMNGYDQDIKDLGGNDEEVCTQDDGFENYDEGDNIVCTQDRLYDNNDDEGDVLKNSEFVYNFDEDDDVICTQDRLFDNLNDAEEEIVTQNRKFVDNFNEHDDEFCTPSYINGDNKAQAYVQDGNFEKDNKDAKQNTEFGDNFDRHDDDVVCTQDYSDYGRKNDVICLRDRDFDNTNKDDDVVCPQNIELNNFDTGNDVIHTHRHFDKDNKDEKQNTEFVDNFDRHDHDVVCAQDISDYGRNNDVICLRDKDLDNTDTDDDVVCAQNRELKNFDTTNDVVRTHDVNGDKNDLFDDSDDSDDEILFIRNKVYDDQPSWFLDCNDNL